MKRIYLDHSASTPVDRRVATLMSEFMLEHFGNPSSIHSFGRKAQNAREEARAKIAEVLHCHPDEIYFTSGGTEADNLALFGYALNHSDKGGQIIISNIEHPAVRNSADELGKQGFDVTRVKADQYGSVTAEMVDKAVTGKTLMVSVIHANNEVGTINDLEAIGGYLRKKNIVFHTDAVQSFGKIPIDLNRMNIDMLSLSAHKIYGPKGVGALYVRRGIKLKPLLQGGPHENGLRAGTENIPGIVGLGKAAELCRIEMEQESKRLTVLRERLKQGLEEQCKGTRLNGHPTNRIPGHLNMSIPGVNGHEFLMALDLNGIAASSGTACASGSIEPSKVLLELGLSKEEARSALRLTLGRSTTEEDIDYTIELISKTTARLTAAGN